MVSKEIIEEVYSQINKKPVNLEELHESYKKILIDEINKVENLNNYLETFTAASIYKHHNISIALIIFGTILVCTAGFIFGFVSRLHIIPNTLLFLATCIPLVLGFILSFGMSSKYKKYQAAHDDLINTVNTFQLHHLVDMYITAQLNCEMYKDVYNQTYTMQEWLKNNDKTGYASFVHACDMTNMDFSKYVEDYTKPSMVDININNYFN